MALDDRDDMNNPHGKDPTVAWYHPKEHVAPGAASDLGEGGNQNNDADWQTQLK